MNAHKSLRQGQDIFAYVPSPPAYLDRLFWAGFAIFFASLLVGGIWRGIDGWCLLVANIGGMLPMALSIWQGAKWRATWRCYRSQASHIVTSLEALRDGISSAGIEVWYLETSARHRIPATRIPIGAVQEGYCYLTYEARLVHGDWEFRNVLVHDPMTES